MKNLLKLLFIGGILFSASQISAQDRGEVEETTSAMSNKMDISTAISQVANGINPDAFKGGFDMAEWQAKLPEVNEADISGMKESLNSLVGGLKNSSFQKDAKSDVMRKLVGLNGKTDISNFLSSLVNGLKPEALTKEFASSKDDFLEGLKMLK